MSDVEAVDLGEEMSAPPAPAGKTGPVKPPERRRAQPVLTPHETGNRPNNGATMGRSPPYSVEAEEHLLSCCLLDGSETIAKCLEAHLTPAAFYIPANQLIFRHLCELYRKSPPVALERLVEELKTAKQLEAVGGVPYLMQVSARIPTTAQAAYFIEKVRELFVLREVIKVATGTVEQCYGFQGGFDEFINDISDSFAQVTDLARNGTSDSGKPALDFTYPAEDDPDCLIGGEEFIGRGGAFLLVSVTSSGKSPLQLDMCMDWAIGSPFCGIRAAHPLRSIIIQHEDSDRYLGKIIGSYVHDRKLNAEQTTLLRENVIVKTLRGCAGAEFYNELARLKKLYQPDIIGINPLYLYVKGDITKPEPAQEAIQNLERVNHDRRSAYFIVHHTGKPPPKEGKPYSDLEDWEAIYMGLGSSIWANWPRASAFLQPTDRPGKYLLRLGKGGVNAGLTHEVPQGAGTRSEPKLSIALRHSERKIRVANRDRPLIVWEYDEEGDKAIGTGRGKTLTEADWEVMQHQVPEYGRPALPATAIVKLLVTNSGGTRPQWQRLVREAHNAGLLVAFKNGYTKVAPEKPK